MYFCAPEQTYLVIIDVVCPVVYALSIWAILQGGQDGLGRQDMRFDEMLCSILSDISTSGREINLFRRVRAFRFNGTFKTASHTASGRRLFGGLEVEKPAK